MPVSREVVLHVAELASVSLEPGEVDALARELEAIVAYVDQLGHVDTEGVEPAISGIPVASPLRADVPEPSLPRERALAGAPSEEDGAFSVPLFVDGSAESS